MKIYTVNATCELADLTARLAAGNPLDEKIVFCEDKFTLELEIALSRKYGGAFGTKVFTFNRFMHKFLPDDGKLLSPESAALVVKRLLLENKGELGCFKNVYDPNLAGVVYELIAQLKSAKIAPADVYRAAEGCGGILKRKLDDIYLIFSAYEKYIAKNGLTDGNNRLSRLPKFFAESEAVKNADVIVAGFPSLNRTLCEIFISLSKNAKSLTFALVAGENKGVYTNETFNFAMTFAGAEHIAEKTAGVRKRLLDSLFSPGVKNKNGEFCPDIHVYRAQSVTEEVEYVAKLIANGVRRNAAVGLDYGQRYKSYAVCAEDISAYYLTIKRVFADYGIPCFFDTSDDLGKHPLTTLVSAYIDTIRRGFAVSDFLRLVKNPLVTPDKALSDGFENYVLKNAIDRKRLLVPFTRKDEKLEEYENLRAKVAGLFSSSALLNKSLLTKSERQGGVAFSAAVEDVERVLYALSAKETIEELGNRLTEVDCRELAAYNAQAYEKFVDVLSAAKAILGDEILPLSEIKNVVVSGMTACKISVIQEFSDCVFVGDFRSAKYKEHEVLFALGLNEGVPATKLDSALLCDRDIVGMEAFDVSVEPKIKEVNRRNRENACMAIAAFSEKLYLSRSVRDADGAESGSSEIIDYVIAAFSDDGSDTSAGGSGGSVGFSGGEKGGTGVTGANESGGKKRVVGRIGIADKRQNDRAAELVGGERGKRYKALPYMTERSSAFGFAREVSAYKEGERKEFDAAAAFYFVMREKGLRALPDGLLGAISSEIGYYTDGVNYAERDISATSIEGFFRCPYQNFLSRAVKLGQREEGDMRAKVVGDLIHEVAREFTIKGNFDGGREEAIALAERLFDEISARDEYSKYGVTGAGRVTFAFLKKETVRFCLNVYDGYSHSSFRPKYIEVSFGYGGDLPAIAVDTRGGRRKIVGKADRIDSFGNKMNIVDYKTGAVTGHGDEDLYVGKKLQLYVYAKAFSDRFEPVGAYYFPVADEFGDDEEAVIAMKGKTLADLATASEIDDSITEENRKGRFISANLTERKTGGGFRYDAGLLTREEFDAYLDYAVKVAGEGISEINDGVIVPSPDDKACEYCEYHGLCGYDAAIDGRTRTVNEKIDKTTIVAAVAENAESEEVEENGDGSGSNARAENRKIENGKVEKSKDGGEE